MMTGLFLQDLFRGQILKELYSNAYVYTLPSDLEGMPLSLLEAMSYGNCCLVSNIPECTEVVEDKALVFKKSDVNDLFTKIQKACDYPEMITKIKEQATDFIFRKYKSHFWERSVLYIIIMHLEDIILHETQYILQKNIKI